MTHRDLDDGLPGSMGGGEPITDTDRLNALQAWLESADLQAGTITLRVPGLAEGDVRVSANLRMTVDGVLLTKGEQKS